MSARPKFYETRNILYVWTPHEDCLPHPAASPLTLYKSIRASHNDSECLFQLSEICIHEFEVHSKLPQHKCVNVNVKQLSP